MVIFGERAHFGQEGLECLRVVLLQDCAIHWETQSFNDLRIIRSEQYALL